MANIFTDGRALNAQELTRFGAALDGTYYFPSAAGGVVTQSSTPAMTVEVSAITKGYTVFDSAVDTVGSAATQVVISAAHATLPRRDAIFYDSAGLIDALDGSAAALTATTGPVLPTLSASQILIAEVYVAPTVTSITTSNITDRRQDIVATQIYQPAQILNASIWVEQGGAVLNSSGAWTTANAAIYIPFRVSRTITAKRLHLANGTTASGNVDVGIYAADAAGLPGARKISIGSTAQSGTSVFQAFDITDTALAPGLYYLAAVADNTSATVLRLNAITVADSRSGGMYEELSAFPLPSTATPVVFSATRTVPLMVCDRGTT